MVSGCSKTLIAEGVLFTGTGGALKYADRLASIDPFIGGGGKVGTSGLRSDSCTYEPALAGFPAISGPLAARGMPSTSKGDLESSA